VSIRAKRIVLAATSDLTHDRRLIRICTSLKASGYDVLLIGRESPASVPLTLRPYRQKRIRCIINTTALFFLGFNIRLFSRLLFTRADVIVANDLDTLLAASIAAWVKRCSLAYDAHEYFTEVPELDGRKFVKKIWELVASLCIPHADICYTVSDSLAQVLSDRYSKEFHTITNAPWPTDYRPVEKYNPKPVLIYRGDINQGRGIEEYIRCMHNIDGILQIAGDGPLRRNL
jgi:glycosyltransferase involved in cell wall biosynthesis